MRVFVLNGRRFVECSRCRGVAPAGWAHECGHGAPTSRPYGNWFASAAQAEAATRPPAQAQAQAPANVDGHVFG